MARPLTTKLKRIVGWSSGTLLTVLVIVISVTIGWRPVMGAKSRHLTDRRFERTPARLARGEYLAKGVAACFDCHSDAPSQWKPGEAPEFTALGSGRVVIKQGDFLLAAPNITPDVETGAGSWTDDQLARAIREGIGHDGRTLFPMMPYQNYKYLSDEDLASIVVYLRSLAPIRNQLPKGHIPFPLSRLINTAPEPIAHGSSVDASDTVARGRYLTKIGNCEYCHTPSDKMDRPLPGMAFAGGKYIDKFPTPSANITPDPSGISYYDEAMFVRALRTGRAGARLLNPPMPWWVFRNMSDDDLKAIYAYLRTVKPVRHHVDKSEAYLDENGNPGTVLNSVRHR
jgi:mono/diheme cytochrome c family protein